MHGNSAKMFHIELLFDFVFQLDSMLLELILHSWLGKDLRFNANRKRLSLAGFVTLYTTVYTNTRAISWHHALVIFFLKKKARCINGL